MSKLHLQIADATQPEDFLRTCARSEMVTVEAKATTIYANTLANARVLVDTKV
jgi:hypothetical protein